MKKLEAKKDPEMGQKLLDITGRMLASGKKPVIVGVFRKPDMPLEDEEKLN